MMAWFLGCAANERTTVPDVYRVEGRVADVRFVEIPSKVNGRAPSSRVEVTVVPSTVTLEPDPAPVPEWRARLAEEASPAGELVLRGDASVWPSDGRAGDTFIIRYVPRDTRIVQIVRARP